LGAELESGGECRPTGSPSGAGTAIASVDIIDDEGASYDRVLDVRGEELFCSVVVVENLDVVEGGESVAVANV
jgi:succinyl-CoA synthetase beta subunit